MFNFLSILKSKCRNCSFMLCNIPWQFEVIWNNSWQLVHWYLRIWLWWLSSVGCGKCVCSSTDTCTGKQKHWTVLNSLFFTLYNLNIDTKEMAMMFYVLCHIITGYWFWLFWNNLVCLFAGYWQEYVPNPVYSGMTVFTLVCTPFPLLLTNGLVL